MSSRTDQLAILGGPPAVPETWQPDWPIIGEEEIDAVAELMRRRVLSIYDRSDVIAELEDAFSEYHSIDGRRPHALTHSCGTASLHAAYFGIGIGPGTEVIAPTYTFLATVMPIFQCHGAPVLADMDPVTLTIDPEDVERRITPRTRAVVVTHLWGHPADMDRICEICDRHGLSLIEDCSHAHGATYRGRRVGTFGDVGCFSLEGHKAMVAGEGGILITHDRRIYERALLLGHFGRRLKQEIRLPEHLPYVRTGLGLKYRMHPLGAAIALVQLRHLDERNEMRRHNLDLLSERLREIAGIEPPVTLPHVTRGGFYGYKPRYVPEQMEDLDLDTYIEALKAEGVQVKRPGSPPLHTLPVFDPATAERTGVGFPWPCSGEGEERPPGARCPIAESVYPRLLSLPTFTLPADELIERYAEAFEKVHRHAGELLRARRSQP
ncbi:MAG: DegT/DnrJ/EryC1/StrS family aminotransferase [bacterium]|nr:DegT/DnrJ/EryC1/StrS family aminotransferase [bacterium]